MISQILEAGLLYLRTQNSWSIKECGVQWQAYPPPTAGGFYVALDDGGVEQLGQIGDAWLKERFIITVGLWRRMSEIAKDYRGKLMLPDHLYSQTKQSLNKMEREIISQLHKKNEFLVAINDDRKANTDRWGCDPYVLPLMYIGRGPNEDYQHPGMRDSNAMFIGRRLRFKGLDRTQALSGMR